MISLITYLHCGGGEVGTGGGTSLEDVRGVASVISSSSTSSSIIGIGGSSFNSGDDSTVKCPVATTCETGGKI